MARFSGVLLLFLLSIGSLAAQLAPDFTITDSEGSSHTLYSGYLNQGKTVLIKVFFTTCPPCNSIAPYMEPLYEDWGSGNYDVEFFDLSDKSFDTDVLVNNYKTNHGHTYPAAGSEGGSLEAVQPYKQGMFGPFYGTPTFIVIAPDGTVQYNVDGSNNSQTIAALDAAIAATGAEKPECQVTVAVDETLCAGDSVEINGQWYDEAGEYQDVISGGDCDTLLWITIMDAPPVEHAISASFCSGDSVFLYDTWYYDAGTFFDLVESQGTGCDTIVTIQLTTHPLNAKTFNVSFPEGDSVLVYGEWYDTEGTEVVLVQSVGSGCDTLVTIHLFEVPDIPQEVTINGLVRTRHGNTPVAGVHVFIKLNGVEIARDTTNAQGQYSFTMDSTFVIANPLEVSASKVVNPLNGISVLDLVAVQKHLLGLQNLDSVEKLYAADVNDSGNISALDLIHLRRVLLGLAHDFPSGQSWLIFPETLVFGAPGEQPPVIETPDPVFLHQILNGTQTGTFRAIKIGDLNNSANPQE